MKNRFFGALLVIVFVLIFALLVSNLTGCGEYIPEAQRVSHNISRQADNFNVTRRLTVINTRTDKCILQMTGKISIEDVTDGIAVLVELDRDKSIYQKHYVYLNGDTMYTVEDVTGVAVSRYAYEMEFMPQSIIPVRITADELQQDAEAFGRKLEDMEQAEAGTTESEAADSEG